MTTSPSFTPIAASTGNPVALSMQRLWLTGQVLPAGARLIVQHVFRSEETQPLEVIYAFPLPRDAALRSFRITGDGFEAHSELKPVQDAVNAYEQGLMRGSLSTLARVHGDGVINLTVGNIRPQETVTVYLEILCGVELRDDGFRFRFPFTLAPTYHAQARAMQTAPGELEMELPPAEFGDVILPAFRADSSTLHEVGFDVSIASQLEFDEVGSPSHAIRIRRGKGRASRISLATEKDVPNRDLVLDARYLSIAPQVLSGRTANGAGHFAAILPSTAFGTLASTPRRIVILLDRSGSMQGAPLAQARKAIEACLSLLSDTDSFGILAFDDRVTAFQSALVPGTRHWRNQAHEFLQTVDARGGTELAAGFIQAAGMFAEGGGDVLILTDGQVSGTEKIIEQARSTAIRLHCLGIGSASQDLFLTLLARETGGVSRFVTPRERVDLSAIDLFAAIGRPVASGLKAGANVQPEAPEFVFSGTPVLLFGETVAGDEAPLTLHWQGGELSLPIASSEDAIADTVRLLQGSRRITDWESRYPSTLGSKPLDVRKRNRVAARLLELSQSYGLASREMALVAVVTRAGDRPGDLPKTRVVPVGMPQDVEVCAYVEAKSVMTGSLQACLPLTPSAHSLPISEILECFEFGDPAEFQDESPSVSCYIEPPPPAEYSTPVDILIDLASRMESDGGLPAKNLELRALRTALAVLAFVSQGHTASAGAFRSHVARMVSFLSTIDSLTAGRQKTLSAVIDAARSGTPIPGDWMKLAQDSVDRWPDLERAMK